MANSRFHKTTAIEIQGLVNKARNSNTDTSAWAKEQGKPENISRYMPEVLNETLCQFYAEICKKDGTEYQPDCLRVMKSGLDRYLKENKYPINHFSRTICLTLKTLKGGCFPPLPVSFLVDNF